MSPCPVCGRLFEGSVVLGNGTRLAGHVPGGPLCVARPAAGLRKHPTVDREPPSDSLSLEERGERLRQKLAADRSPTRVSDRLGDIFGPADEQSPHSGVS